MSLAKRLAAEFEGKPQKRVAVKMEPNEKLDRLAGPGIMTPVQAGLYRAAVKVMEQAAENLRAHDSTQTGTDAGRTREAREYRESLGPTLADQLMISPVYEAGEQIGFDVHLHPNVEYLGRFLEETRQHVFWGGEEGERVGTPWLQPAMDQVDMMSEIREGTANALKDDRNG